VFASAQSNYKPGYAVTLKGDTLKGFIDYKEWDENPSSIDFKSNLSDRTSQKLTVEDIKIFSIAGYESYQKYTGLIGTDYVDPNHINYGKDTSFRMATVFLKKLAEGKNVVVLSYTDDIRSHYYIEEAPAFIPKELIYHIYKENDAQTNAIKTKVDNEYITQLYFLAQKYNVLTSDLQMDMEHMGYYADDFIRIANKINGVTQANNAKNEKRVRKIRFFAGVGVNVTSTIPDSFDFAPLGATNYTSALPLVSVGFNLPLNTNIEKVVLRCELTVSGNHYYTSYNDKVFPYVPIIYKYSTIAVAFTPQILYNFYNTDDLKIFGGIGFSLSYYSYMNGSYTQKNGNPVPNNSANPYYFIPFSTPIVFKAGIRLRKNFEIYADYVTGSPVSDDEVFKLSFSSFQAGVNYYFK
jgi:hypothetical protein